MTKQNLINTNLIENFIKENKLTITKFCKLCNISYGSYKKIMNCTIHQFTPVLKVAIVMNVSLDVLINKK